MHARTSRIRNTTTTLFALAAMFAGAAALAAPSDDEIIYDLRLELNFEADNLEQVHHEIDRIFLKYNSPALAAQMLELSRQDFANDSLDETHADIFHLALLMKKLGDDRLIDEAFADHLDVKEWRFVTIVSALTLSTTDRAYEALRKKAESLTSEFIYAVKNFRPVLSDDEKERESEIEENESEIEEKERLFQTMIGTLAEAPTPKHVEIAAAMRRKFIEETKGLMLVDEFVAELDRELPNLKMVRVSPGNGAAASGTPLAGSQDSGTVKASETEKQRFKPVTAVWLACGIALLSGLVFLVSRWLKRGTGERGQGTTSALGRAPRRGQRRE